MNSTLTFTANADTATADTTTAAEMPVALPALTLPHTKTSAAAKFRRTLACKWDMLAVIALMLICGAYGIYAITQMTGFEQSSSQAPLRPAAAGKGAD